MNDLDGCRALFSAVIAQAIKDASTPVSRSEIEAGRNFNPDVQSAIYFLFFGESLEFYAGHLDMSAQAIRDALILGRGRLFEDKTFTEKDRRNINLRRRLWQESHR